MRMHGWSGRYQAVGEGAAAALVDALGTKLSEAELAQVEALRTRQVAAAQVRGRGPSYCHIDRLRRVLHALTLLNARQLVDSLTHSVSAVTLDGTRWFYYAELFVLYNKQCARWNGEKVVDQWIEFGIGWLICEFN